MRIKIWWLVSVLVNVNPWSSLIPLCTAPATHPWNGHLQHLGNTCGRGTASDPVMTSDSRTCGSSIPSSSESLNQHCQKVFSVASQLSWAAKLQTRHYWQLDQAT